ncbi:MAG: tetratricopeptide repeat protein, partial [Thermoplasmata archaeon]
MPLFGKRSSNKTFVQVLRDTLEEGKNYSSVDPTKARVTIRKILRMIEDASKQEKQAIMENKEEVINILWEAGRTLYDLNDREKAFDFFEKIKELNPNDYKPWFEIGKTLLTLNIQIPYATVNLKKALELNPDNVETLVLLGDVYRIQKDLENAKKYYKEALKKDPGRADIAEKILTIDPNDVEVLKLLLNYYLKIDDKLKVAEVYAHLASVENNMEYIQKALELNPDNVNILKTKIRLLIENKNFQEAKVTLDRLIELVPSDSEIYILKELINNKSSENKLFEEIKPESNAVKESALFDELVGSENQVKGIENIMPDEIIAKEKSQEEKVELPEEKEEKVELPEEKE